MELRLPDIPDYETLEHYLGGLDEYTRCTADMLMEKLRAVCTPRETHREYAVLRKSDGIYLFDERFEGEDIKKHLADCDRCVVLAVTLGVKADGLLRAFESSDMSAAVILDSLASVLTEQVCDQVQDMLEKEYEGYFLTDRYSPGYGDLPLSANKTIERMLETPKRIGATVLENFLLLPRKTVTAIIGISEKETKGHMAGCENCCVYEKCTLRREGKSCGSKDI